MNPVIVRIHEEHRNELLQICRDAIKFNKLMTWFWVVFILAEVGMVVFGLTIWAFGLSIWIHSFLVAYGCGFLWYTRSSLRYWMEKEQAVLDIA